MEMDNDFLIGQKISELENVVIFGGGFYGMIIMYLLQNKGIQNITCMDNGVEKQGLKILSNIECIKPIFIEGGMVIVPISDVKAAQEITEQCKKLGYEKIIYPDFEKLKRIFQSLSDKEYCELQYAICFEGKVLNWERPKTWNEKIQWLKLYDRKQEYIKLVDKYEVKKYLIEKIGEEYVIPTLGVWENFDDIDFTVLPEQFVLKCTHDAGSIVICKDIKNFDMASAKEKLQKALRRNFYNTGREWPYKQVRPRIIAEKYLQSNARERVTDYKLMCFNGKVRCSYAGTERESDSGVKVSFYDREWKSLPFEWKHYPRSGVEIQKPIMYDKMIEIAESISKKFAFLRVDFYELEGRIYIGELTLYPGAGFLVFIPEEWDYTLGSWLTLPS